MRIYVYMFVPILESLTTERSAITMETPSDGSARLAAARSGRYPLTSYAPGVRRGGRATRGRARPSDEPPAPRGPRVFPSCEGRGLSGACFPPSGERGSRERCLSAPGFGTGTLRCSPENPAGRSRGSAARRRGWRYRDVRSACYGRGRGVRGEGTWGDRTVGNATTSDIVAASSFLRTLLYFYEFALKMSYFCDGRNRQYAIIFEF